MYKTDVFSTNAKVPGKQAVLADKIVVDVGSKVFQVPTAMVH